MLDRGLWLGQYRGMTKNAVRTWEVLENDQTVDTVRARSAEGAIRAARRRGAIYASDYGCRRGQIVELEWTARAVEGQSEPTVTLTLKARAK